LSANLIGNKIGESKGSLEKEIFWAFKNQTGDLKANLLILYVNEA